MTDINLEDLCKNCYNAKESRSKFYHIIFKMKKPAVTVLLYKNGKFIMTGIRTYCDIDNSLNQFYKLLLKNGIFFVARAWKLVNITITGKEKQPISLIKFKRDNITTVDYEPEIFPACVYTFTDTKTKALIFKSGKYIITGIKDFNKMSFFDTEFRKCISVYKCNSLQ